ncbi:two pore domain potassium channel family protein [Candidatus Berkelbacteria bacterium]|nr:two pore domain potassium channel family protein [Candidatus Berkelbacteria bacterium]
MPAPTKHTVRFEHRIQDALWALLVLLVAGTITYRVVEGWSWVDSFYFTGVTMLTIGYGDFTPTHDLSKILTVVFGFASISIVLYTFSFLGREVHRHVQELPDHLHFGNHGPEKHAKRD